MHLLAGIYVVSVSAQVPQNSFEPPAEIPSFDLGSGLTAPEIGPGLIVPGQPRTIGTRPINDGDDANPFESQDGSGSVGIPNPQSEDTGPKPIVPFNPIDGQIVSPEDAQSEIYQLSNLDSTKLQSLETKLREPEAGLCTVAVQQYSSALDACENNCTQYTIARHSDNQGHPFYKELQNIKAARLNFDLKCFGALTSGQQDWPNLFTKKYVFERTGVLVIEQIFEDDPDEPFCGAGVLESGRVITSKHCFIDNNGRLKSNLMTKMEKGKIKFYAISDPNKPYIIKAIEGLSENDKRKKFSGDASSDYLYLNLRQNIPIVNSTVLRKATPLDEAIVIGWFEAADPKRKTVPDLPEWGKAVRWSKPVCFALNTSDKCLVHSCSTEQGFSGSPIWTISSGKGTPAISGIQSTYSNAHNGCQFKERVISKKLNLATSKFLED